MMKQMVLPALLALMMTACGDSAPSSVAGAAPAAPVAPEPAKIQEPPPKPNHNYAMKDGSEYGYEPAISDNAQKAGQAAAELLMFKYAGKKDGQHQVYMKKGATTMVVQCGNPCEFIKVMTFYQKEHIKTERLRARDGMIGWMVLQDAMNGHMDQWVVDRDGKKGMIWFSESGPKFTPNS